jgi:hypothetical protein
MTHSDSLDFRNATKADPDRNMSYPACIASLSRQHCIISTSMTRTEPSDAFRADAIKVEDVKMNQSEGGGSFKLSFCVSMTVSLMVM